MCKIRAIIKRPFEPVGRITEISNTLRALQDAVGGYIETVTIATDLVIICDEEGRIKGKAPNCSIAGVDFVGTILAVGKDGEEFADVPLTLEAWERMFIGGTNGK